ILLISAGKISWLNGWLFFGLILGYEMFYVGLFIKVNPGLLNERGKVVPEGGKLFDKIFAVLYLPLYFSILIISGIDAGRYEWTIMPLWVIVFGVVMFLLSSFLSFWAMYVNSYFECTVRIQEDRNQEVVTTGPYRIIRHPGYIAGIISFLAAPLILGSWWGFIPSSILILTIVIRTALEDRTLQRELSGYNDYTKVTRYRLIPFIW
ncbi:MAG: methyltransferase family protein, partial [Bacteroidales bacterium]